MTAAERARAVARQRSAHLALKEALAKRGCTLPSESQLVDVETSAALLAELHERFRSARLTRQHQLHTGLDRAQLAEHARSYFSRQRDGQPLCRFGLRRDLGALALPAAFLSEHLGLLLEVDGDAVFGRWGSEAFDFDYTADLGPTGYEVLITTDS